ncbi:MAG: hypothetical protein Q8R11_02175, partial [bacterium]|nr:hypothetical protein [bacterium]
MTERNQIQPRRAYLCEAGVTLKFKMEENDPLDEIVHRLSQLPTSLRVLFQEATGTRNVDPSSIASHVTDLLTATLMRPQMPQLEPTWRFLESAQNIRDIRALLHPDRCLSAVAALVTTTFLLDQMTRPIETTVYGAEQRHLVAQKYWGVLFHNLKEKFRAQEPEFSCLPVVRTQKTTSTLKSQLEQFRIFEPKNDAELEQFIRTLYRLADFRHSQLYQYMHGGMEETRQDEMEKMFQFLEPDNDFLKRVPLLYFKERFDNLGYDKRHNLLMHVILILQEEGTL